MVDVMKVILCFREREKSAMQNEKCTNVKINQYFQNGYKALSRVNPIHAMYMKKRRDKNIFTNDTLHIFLYTYMYSSTLIFIFSQQHHLSPDIKTNVSPYSISDDISQLLQKAKEVLP